MAHWLTDTAYKAARALVDWRDCRLVEETFGDSLSITLCLSLHFKAVGGSNATEEDKLVSFVKNMKSR